MDSEKRTLLYISPTIPAPSGNGRAMRAFNIIKYLSHTHHIHLLVISREIKSSKNHHINQKIIQLCESINCIPINPRKDLSMLFRVRLFKLSRRLYYQFFKTIETLYCSPKMIRTLNTGGQNLCPNRKIKNALHGNRQYLLLQVLLKQPGIDARMLPVFLCAYRPRHALEQS